MNLRHAAALALVGWMVMTPKIYDGDTNPHIQPNDPLSLWVNESNICCTTPETDNFHSKSVCEKEAGDTRHLGKILADHLKDPDIQKRLTSLRRQQLNAELESYAYAQCVSTDDARLKKSWWSILRDWLSQAP